MKTGNIKKCLTNYKCGDIIKLTTVVVYEKEKDKMPRQIITESEYELMHLLWQAKAPMTVGEIYKCLPESENKWSRNTVATLLTRLTEKGVINYETKGKYHCYYAVLGAKDYSIRETKSFLSKLFGGSVKNMVASLYESKELSKSDIDDLRDLFNLK